MVTQTLGVSVVISSPLVLSDISSSDTFCDEVSSYSQKISAWLGYDTCLITLSVDRFRAEEIISKMLMSDVVCYGPDGSEIWRGFANEIETGFGTVSAKRGPVMGITNLCYVLYALIDASVDPPFVGDRTITTGATNQMSIDRYGYFERVIQGGQRTQTEAEQIRDTHLKDAAFPETGKTVNLGAQGSIHVRIKCAGYGHLLSTYLYTSGSSGYITVKGKIEAIISAELNSIFSSDFSQISDNGILVPAYEGDYPIAMEAIKYVVDLGDANDNRYTFGIYENNKFSYKQAPTEYRYAYSEYDREQYITDVNNDSVVHPCSVRPAELLYLKNILSGSGMENAFEEGKRTFLESVTFTAPNELSIEHSKTSSLERKLAKLALGTFI